MKWDPVIIKWCLYLCHLAGGNAYEMLRESGVVKLPSQRTLRDYTFYTKTTCGFSDDVDQQSMETAKLDTCEEKDKYIFWMRCILKKIWCTTSIQVILNFDGNSIIVFLQVLSQDLLTLET